MCVKPLPYCRALPGNVGPVFGLKKKRKKENRIQPIFDSTTVHVPTRFYYISPTSTVTKMCPKLTGGILLLLELFTVLETQKQACIELSCCAARLITATH